MNPCPAAVTIFKAVFSSLVHHMTWLEKAVTLTYPGSAGPTKRMPGSSCSSFHLAPRIHCWLPEGPGTLPNAISRNEAFWSWLQGCYEILKNIFHERPLLLEVSYLHNPPFQITLSGIHLFLCFGKDTGLLILKGSSTEEVEGLLLLPWISSAPQYSWAPQPIALVRMNIIAIRLQACLSTMPTLLKFHYVEFNVSWLAINMLETRL
jgi:hypothetical protein